VQMQQPYILGLRLAPGLFRWPAACAQRDSLEDITWAAWLGNPGSPWLGEHARSSRAGSLRQCTSHGASLMNQQFVPGCTYMVPVHLTWCTSHGAYLLCFKAMWMFLFLLVYLCQCAFFSGSAGSNISRTVVEATSLGNHCGNGNWANKLGTFMWPPLFLFV